jgi:hypothetical protein
MITSPLSAVTAAPALAAGLLATGRPQSFRRRSLLVSLAAAIGLAGCSGAPTPMGPSRTLEARVDAGAVTASQAATSQAATPQNMSWQCVATAASGVRGAECPVVASQKLSARFGAATVAPSNPSNLTASVSGSTVSLAWSAPTGAQPATNYFLQAGSASGLSNLANSDTGSAALSIVVTSVPAGTYFVRVVAANGGSLSGPSNEVVLTVGGGTAPCASAPNAPGNLAASVNGTAVTLSWTAPAAGCAATAFTLQAGSASGLSNLAATSTGGLATTFSASGLGTGTYFVRVLATNASGSSGPSNEATFRIGSSAPGAGPSIPTFVRIGATVTYDGFSSSLSNGQPFNSVQVVEASQVTSVNGGSVSATTKIQIVSTPIIQTHAWSCNASGTCQGDSTGFTGKFWVDPANPVGSIKGPNGETFSIVGTSPFSYNGKTWAATTMAYQSNGVQYHCIFETTTGLIVSYSETYPTEQVIIYLRSTNFE